MPRLHDDFKHHYICEFLLLLLITGVGIMDSSASQPVASVGNCCRASKIFGVQEMCRCVGEVCETGPLLDASSTVTLQVDELWASGKFLIQCNSPCVLALTKTLLRNKTDSELEVDGFGKRFLLVRDSSETSKSLSGGLCLYGNKNWCNTDYQGDYAQLKLNSCLYPCDPFVYIQLKARVDTNYSTFFFFLHDFNCIKPLKS